MTIAPLGSLSKPTISLYEIVMSSCKQSSRALSRSSGEFIRTTAGSQSLARGINILRAFKLGTGALSNSDLAERTELPRPTVSRLTRILVESGLLCFDTASRNYSLGPQCLSLGQSARRNSDLLRRLHPIMRKIADGHRINIGLAIPDGQDMVYLESVRRDHSPHFDHVETGSRIPMELTALGRAHLSTLSKASRARLFGSIARRYGSHWLSIRCEIQQAARDITAQGYCTAAWQRGIVSAAAPIMPGYVLNVSCSTRKDRRLETSRRCGRLLLQLLKEDRG